MIVLFFDFFHPAFKAGGPIKSGLALYHLLKEMNLPFTIYTRSRDMDGVKLNDTHFLGQVEYSDNLALVKLVKDIISSKVVVLNSFFSFHYSILPLLIALFYKKKIFIFSRGELNTSALATGKRNIKSLYLLVVSFFRERLTVVVSDEAERDSANKVFSEIVVLPNFRLDLFQRKLIFNSDKLDSVGRLKSDPVFGVLGRFNTVKNQLGFLCAMREIDYKGLIYLKGPFEQGDYVEKCYRTADSLNVNFEDGSRDIISFLSKIDFLVVPSLSENFGHVIFEAASIGVPVITSVGVPLWYEGQFIVDFKDISEVDRLILHLKEQDYKLLSELAYRNINHTLYKILNENKLFIKDSFL